ncbi:MAG: ECF transporter S component, partial [Christensenellaceae bacterium]
RSGLADLTLGSALYAPATVVIKGLMALAAGAITKKPNLSKYILACVVGGLIMAGGYGLYEVMIFGASAAVLTVVPNLIQAACGIVIASALYKPMQLLRNKIGLRNTK